MIIMVVMVIITKIVSIRDARAAFFWRGGAEETNFGVGRAGQGVKPLGQGGVKVKLGARRGSLENFQGRGNYFARGRATSVMAHSVA